jgi:D-arabinose 1-dehydrogenase-like Zn-dependent alcohol dehydrogenase
VDHEIEESQKFITSTIANLGYYMAVGMKFEEANKIEFDNLAYTRKVINARNSVSPKTARIFLHLVQIGRLNSWVLKEIDIDFIKLAV